MTNSYFAGLVTGVLGGITLLKFFETFLASSETDDEADTNRLKDALLSHALQVVYPNRTSSRYYITNGKYLPPFLETLNGSPNGTYRYAEGMRRYGINRFIERYLNTAKQQQAFFNYYWALTRPVNESREELQTCEAVNEAVGLEL